MRKIKFRVWTEGYKKILKPEEFAITGEGRLIIFDYWPDGEQNKQWDFDCYNQNESFYKIEQFTGLKDFTGRDIYEGDILKGTTPFYSKDLSTNSPIGYVDCFMLCEYQNESARFRLKDISKNGYSGWDFHEGMVNNIEIVGNIFESPELLQK